MPRGKSSTPGDTRWSPNGYHYTRTATKWELTHRLVAEQQLGRPLKANERVRLKDGDKSNFADPENIVVYVVREQSLNSRRARLEQKIEELQAELDAMDAAGG